MEDEQSSGFWRQRRNVFLGSCIVAFAEFADVTVSKINVLGTELQIKNPQTVNVALWLVAIYWMWRYYQYYRALDGERGIWDAMWVRLKSKILDAPAIENLKKNVPGFKDAKAGIENPIITYKVDVIELLEAGPQVLGLVPSWLKLAVTVEKTEKARYAPQSASVQHKMLGVNFDFPQLIVPYLRAFVHITMHTTKTTDYLLPFAVFLIPVAYKVFEAARSIWPHGWLFA